MKLGLIGGTFNPIHYGHLIISEYIRNNYNLDKVVFLPSGMPPHKLNNVAPSCHRKNMVELAIESNPFFKISLQEINREGRSYTVDTLKEFKDQYSNDEIYFIIGADSLFELTTWKDFKTIAKLTNFIVGGRPGQSESDILKKMKELKDIYGFNIDYIKVPLVEISSTLIRENIKNNKSIKYLVSEKVEEYIYSNKLYIQE